MFKYIIGVLNLDNHRRNKSIESFTLVELLIVMAIIGVVAIVGAGGFISMQNVQIREQAAADVMSDLEYVKTSALLNKRIVGEGWVWAIGIDFSNWSVDDLDAGDTPEDRSSDEDKYHLIKYCSGESGYEAFSIADADLDFTGASTSGSHCADIDEELVFFENRKGSVHDRVGDIEIISVSSGEEVDYVLFEVITGKVYIVEKDGDMMQGGAILRLNKDDKTKYIGINHGSGIQLEVDDPTTNTSCGDGYITGSEECDDGNNSAGDGCDATCNFEGS